MSVLLQTDLTEYARQCTLQRRRYEECVQAAQRNGMDQNTATSACSIAQPDVAAQTKTSVLDDDTESVAQGSLVDLLGLSGESSTWDDEQVTASDAAYGARRWHDDRAPVTQQNSAAPKSVSPVSYGAP